VVDLDRPAAEAAALLWAERAGPARTPDLGDILIAGTARAAGMDALTADEGFADLAGAHLLRPS
jgi:predicted nucleic acid-binding protein